MNTLKLMIFRLSNLEEVPLIVDIVSLIQYLTTALDKRQATVTVIHNCEEYAFRTAGMNKGAYYKLRFDGNRAEVQLPLDAWINPATGGFLKTDDSGWIELQPKFYFLFGTKDTESNCIIGLVNEEFASTLQLKYYPEVEIRG